MVAGAVAWAADVPGLDPETYYAVTYALNETDVQTIRPAKIVGLSTLGSKTFLVVDVGGPQKAIGYLELDRVRAILPTQGLFSVDPESN